MSDETPKTIPPRAGRPVRGSRTGRPVMALLDLLGRRWTLRLLWELHTAGSSPLTFRAIQGRCEDMSSSVLSDRLGELRQAQLIEHDRGGYRLSALGAELVGLLLPLDAWATRWGGRETNP
ncbi:winged helix-turn-helix transcriptional regulator [Nocardioides sp. T2.26MG-1]|uniref:winged helix-turn-helix transcriptional regulator n=1 Tax=Nocardioides sp. T2.26MG-1 TaxID=3041166 RepID=UPI00253FC80D|nr:helix-turn-helix domain-containing protein [Nocardioides sp. T2.26MG-1]